MIQNPWRWTSPAHTFVPCLFLRQMSDFCGDMSPCMMLLASDKKSTPAVLSQYKIYLNIKHYQGFPSLRTTYKSNFSVTKLSLKSQLNTHKFKQAQYWGFFFPLKAEKKQGGKLAGTVTTGSCHVAALIKAVTTPPFSWSPEKGTKWLTAF